MFLIRSFCWHRLVWTGRGGECDVDTFSTLLTQMRTLAAGREMQPLSRGWSQSILPTL